MGTVSELTRRSATGTVSERLAQGPYVAARVGFEPATLQTQGAELGLPNESPRPTTTTPHLDYL